MKVTLRFYQSGVGALLFSKIRAFICFAFFFWYDIIEQGILSFPEDRIKFNR